MKPIKLTSIIIATVAIFTACKKVSVINQNDSKKLDIKNDNELSWGNIRVHSKIHQSIRKRYSIGKDAQRKRYCKI